MRPRKKERLLGTVVRGLRGPIIRQGDDLVRIAVDTLLKACDSEDIKIENRDILCITEAVLARAQGNYATIHQIGKDVKTKLGGDIIGVVFPIFSRNRFGVCLRGIARGAKKVVMLLNYPSDEVGNHLVDLDTLDLKGINPCSDVLTKDEFTKLFGKGKHAFTGVDYVSYYERIVKEEGAECEIVFSNNPKTILEYTSNVLVCDIHSRNRTKRLLMEDDSSLVVGLDEILSQSVDESGFNREYGLLGSNKATEESVKLFPRDSNIFVEQIQEELLKKTGKLVEVMVYGDGAFRDPVEKIWELADPVVSPGFTKGLIGTPSEVKLKYLADNDFKNLSGKELKKAISEYIMNKEAKKDEGISLGTTPRNMTDLIGSLCDLTSGSGDKGTPFVFIQGYFDNYTQ